MEAARTSEMSVNFYQTTRRNNPEDSHLHTSLKSHYHFVSMEEIYCQHISVNETVKMCAWRYEKRYNYSLAPSIRGFLGKLIVTQPAQNVISFTFYLDYFMSIDSD
jgi:hypothetical protein